MDKFTVKIKTLTPIWTGGITGRPEDLKMSGIIGGMRHAFEMLVRKHGGYTCDPSSKNAKCLFKLDKDGKLEKPVCPVCAVFGCTGLKRSFKLKMENSNSCGVSLPIKDLKIKNRASHYNYNKWYKNNRWVVSRDSPFEYKSNCNIESWIAATLGATDASGGIPRRSDPSTKIFIHQLSLIYSNDSIDLSIISIRKKIAENCDNLEIEKIIKYLLLFISNYMGLGAKNYQGWGIFEIEELDSAKINKIITDGIAEIEKLREYCKYSSTDNSTFMNAENCFCYEWEFNNYQIDNNSDSFGFEWWPNQKKRKFYEIGYAMNYRMRRCIKFFNVSTPNDYNDLPPNSKPVLWNNNLDFVRILFGRDEAKNDKKSSGIVGISHLFKKNDKWYLRLFGCIPPVLTYDYLRKLSNLDIPANNKINQFEKRQEVVAFLVDRLKSMVPDMINYKKEKTLFGREHV